MSSFNEIRLPDGNELALAEWLHYPIYSSIDIGQGDTVDLSAFSYTRGDIVPHTATPAARQANETDTNVVRRQKMNQDEALVVMSITYEQWASASSSGGSPAQVQANLPAMSATALRALQRDLIVELLVGAGIKKPQHGVTFAYIGQAIGVPQWNSTTRPVHIGTGGYPTPHNMRMLSLPIYIGGFGEAAKPGNSMMFKLRVRSPRGPLTDVTGTTITQRWWLNGLKKRPA